MATHQLLPCPVYHSQIESGADSFTPLSTSWPVTALTNNTTQVSQVFERTRSFRFFCLETLIAGILPVELNCHAVRSPRSLGMERPRAGAPADSPPELPVDGHHQLSVIWVSNLEYTRPSKLSYNCNPSQHYLEYKNHPSESSQPTKL